MPLPPLQRLRPAARRLVPSRMRLKVSVFMVPLLLPVGQNLSRQPAGADGSREPERMAVAEATATNPEQAQAVGPGWNKADAPE